MIQAIILPETDHFPWNPRRRFLLNTVDSHGWTRCVSDLLSFLNCGSKGRKDVIYRARWFLSSEIYFSCNYRNRWNSKACLGFELSCSFLKYYQMLALFSSWRAHGWTIAQWRFGMTPFENLTLREKTEIMDCYWKIRVSSQFRIRRSNRRDRANRRHIIAPDYTI